MADAQLRSEAVDVRTSPIPGECLAANATEPVCLEALIIGGGPAGLATALMLAQRGWAKVTVIEKRVTADSYEPDKAFHYQIDGRGQKLTDSLGLTQALSTVGVASQEFYLTRIQANGSRKTVKLPIADPARKTAYWLPRRTFLRLLYEQIEADWRDRITVLFNTECVQIQRTAIALGGEQTLQVIARPANGNLIKFEPRLLVGCDGVNSIVRQTLNEWEQPTSDRFQMMSFPSPSSGLRYKVLKLPPQFPLDHSGEDQAVCTMAYAIRGAFRDRQRSVSLGILPVRNPDQPRTANIITRPDHEIWRLTHPDQVYSFLEKAFPQLPVRQIVTPEEAARFAASQGGRFPPPQFCCGLHYLVEPNSAAASNAGSAAAIVLLGDAIHCFPPDIGQGVNSALEEVCVLKNALASSDDDLSRALPLCASSRLPDVKALVRLAQIAFPWQYNQAPNQTRLWQVNFFLRLVLSRLLPGLINPPAFLLIQNHQLGYSELLDKAQWTTRILYTFGLILLIVIGAGLTLLPGSF